MPDFLLGSGKHQCCSKSRSPYGDHVLLLIVRKARILLLLDQIKPIEQLVPVS